MEPLLQKFEKQQIERLTQGKEFPEFRPGDTLRVHLILREGGIKERTQIFEGVCIARRGGNTLQASFEVRRVTVNGLEVLRGFWLYSPLVSKIEVVRRGKVRRAKLYYLRALTGKKARIREDTSSRGTPKASAPALSAEQTHQ